MARNITPRSKDYPQWYLDVIKAAELADYSPVKGCMVIRPTGYALWEAIQADLDLRFKETGHVNAYFPVLIPASFLNKEAQHIEGFAMECAVVTHSGLKKGEKGLEPKGELEEPLIVRPTSETIIGHMMSQWIKSYRDLPMLLNQWANVMRWEMRTRMFLRTSEFLWQEGHTVHATAQEAMEETMRMLDVYADFAENFMAMPVIKGEKTPEERFPGAVNTYTIEAMMQDRKALQSGTSHFLGQNFAKASGIKFLNQESREEIAWTTSWGVSTRLVGGLLMTHSDDDGLILPPRLAPHHVVIMPIYRNDEEKASVLEFCNSLKAELQAQTFGSSPVEVNLDLRDLRGGEKSWQHVKRGVPLRVEVGPRDVASGSVAVARRDQEPKAKMFIPRAEFVATVGKILTDMQANLLNKARKYRDEHTRNIDSWDDFVSYFTPKNEDKPEIHGGFAMCHWSPGPEAQDKLKDLKVTARCIPLTGDKENGKCLFSGRPSQQRVVFAKSY